MSLVGGIRAEDGWGVFLGMSIVLGLVNAIIAPIIKILTCPLILLSLGLFTLVINAAMLLLASSIGQGLGLGFAVDGFWPALWGSIIISVVSFALSAMAGVNQES
jgi:putative membrane protein